MKRTAFLQACLLFLLLVGSWFLLINKLHQPDETGPDASPAGQHADVEPEPQAELDEEARLAEAIPDAEPEAVVPEGWREWTAYLEDVASPDEMRAALDALRNALFSLPPDEAVARLLEFIESGADVKTGLAFQPGPENRLRGAASLRALLLDWLQQLDPRQAAAIAARELDSLGTRLSPDVYVIHLRNYALGSDDSDTVIKTTLEDHFRQLVEHRPWLENPGSAIAEAMDVAVYLEAADVAPRLGQFLQPEQPRLLRHAASLALERLVDQDPMEVLPRLLDAPEADALPARSRASYMARLDPGLPGADTLLDAYIRDPGRDPSEIVFFLESFPNLNQSRSYNLLSNNNSATEPGGYVDRLDNALEQVRRWQDDPGLSRFDPVLEEVGERLQQQLGPNP
jgi:hypothetical protein